MADILNSFEGLLEEPLNQEELENPIDQQEPTNPDITEPQKPEDPEGGEEDDDVGDNEEPTNPDYSNNSLYSFLQSRGIKDPSKVQFENEDGTTEEVDFNTLSAEEQLEILNQVTDPGLSQSEINAINYMRQNGNVTLEQVVDYFAEKRLSEYLNEHPEAVHQKVYAIDDYTDDDLFLIDLKNRYPEFTDEELNSKLEAAKANEDLFKKEAEMLRKTFKDWEDQAVADKEQQEKQQVEDLRNNLMNAAAGFNEVQLDYTDDKSDSLVIEEEDKQQMLSYILDQDAEGKSQLVHDLENPDTLIELAWLRTKGAQVLSGLTQYWKKLLADERSTNKKLQSQIEKLNKKGSSSVIVPQDPLQKKINVGESVWDNSGLI